MSTQNIAAASNAIVASVGFYAGALEELNGQLQTMAARAGAVEQKVAELATANMTLQVEETAARRVVEVVRIYLAKTVDFAEDPPAVGPICDLIEALKVYDVRPSGTAG